MGSQMKQTILQDLAQRREQENWKIVSIKSLARKNSDECNCSFASSYF